MNHQTETSQNLDTLRNLARYQVHGGYVWAGVAWDGDLLCIPCIRANYRQVFRATADASDKGGFGIIGAANSGDSESTEYCAHCNKLLWEL